MTTSASVATVPASLAHRYMRQTPYGALSVAAAVAAWWFATDVLGLGNSVTMCSPLEAVKMAVRLLSEPFAGATLGGHLRDSLARWVAGVGAAVALGIPLGLLMGWNRIVNALVAPVFEPLRNVPPLAWIPLMIVWFGTSTLSQVAVVFVGAFPPCVLTGYRAIRIVDPVQLAAASTLGAGAWTRAVEVALPAGLPTIFAGLRIAFGNGWMALIGAELVGASTGLGFLIIRGQENLSAAIIIVGMVTIGITGLVLDALLAAFSRRALPWRQSVQTHD